MSVIKASTVEIIADVHGAKWFLFTHKTPSTGSKTHSALSPNYLPHAYAFIWDKGSWNGTQDAMDDFAKKHQDARTTEKPYWHIDQNGVPWTLAIDKGTFTDDMVAGTDGYGGAFVMEGSEGELLAEVTLFAMEQKKPPKPPIVDPTPQPPVVVNPPPPAPPPVIEPPPVAPSRGMSTTSLVLTGGALAALIYLLRSD